MENEDKNEEIEELDYQIYLVGYYMAGTTSLLQRYFYDNFEDEIEPFQKEQFYEKNIELDNGKKISILFWDLRPNSFNIYTISNFYLKRADGFMLNYDKTRRNTFQHLQYYLENIKRYYKESIGDITLVLNGCKKDLLEKEEITKEEGESFAKDNNLIFFETSSKENYNVKECFDLLISKVVEREPNYKKDTNNIPINLKKEKTKKKNCLK